MIRNNKESIKETIKIAELEKRLEKTRSQWWYPIYYFFRYAISNYIEDLSWRVPNYFHRAYYGWGRADTWYLSYYLAKVIRDSLIYLKKNKTGVPVLFVSKHRENFSFLKKEWNRTLDTMIWTFNMDLELQEGVIRFPCSGYSENWYKKELELCKKLNKKINKKYRPITLKEYKKYNLGWYYFKKYFHGLWN